jgi:hypothetical protein
MSYRRESTSKLSEILSTHDGVGANRVRFSGKTIAVFDRRNGPKLAAGVTTSHCNAEGDRMRKSVWCAVYAALALFALATTATAQTITTGSLVGTIADQSAAVLPGVSITATSPSLQVPQMVVVSDSRGEYQFLTVPIGTYKLTFELAGFSTFVREGLLITAGFQARVDASMKLATQTETITVSGESPLIDVSTTRGGANVLSAELLSLPTASNYQDSLVLVPGAQMIGPPLNGETGFRGNTSSFKSYGLTGQQQQTIEGIMMTGNEQPDFTAVESLSASTYGNTAEITFPGTVTQLLIKSGGNQYHGRESINGMDHSFMQGSNISNWTSLGATQNDAPLHYWLATGDVGGPVIHDQLWFYGSLFELQNLRTSPGYLQTAGPQGYLGTGGVPGEIPGEQRNRLIKFSYQMTPKNRLIGFYSFNLQVEPQVNASVLNPFEATLHFTEDSRQDKVEWQSAISNKLFASVIVGRGWYTVYYYNNSNNPTATNLSTGLNTGGSWASFANVTRVPSREQLTATVTYAPTPIHNIKTGFNMWWGRNETATYSPLSGNLEQIYSTVAGVPNTPVQVQTRNYPTDGLAGYDTFGAFVTDTWTVTKRLTANLGVRAEHQWAFLPAQTKVQGEFGNSGSFSAIDAGNWTTLAPRLGGAFDVFGNGRTLAKASWGVYYFNLGGIFSDFAQQYNQNTVVTTTYSWNAAAGSAYQPGQVNFALNGPNFQSISGATNALQNPDLKIPHQNEVTASVEQDLGHNLGLRALYVYKAAVNQTQNVNILTPYSAWNQPYTRAIPSPTGQFLPGNPYGTLTIYDYNPAYKGSAFTQNQLQNDPTPDTFNNFEVSLNRRKSGKWYAETSFVATKNDRQIILIPQGPNDVISNGAFRFDETWELSYRASGAYDFPLGITASTLIQVMNGLNAQRTYSFTTVDPSGGPRFVSSSVITLPVEPFGATHGQIREFVNARVTRHWNFGRTSLEVYGDGTNLLNGSTPWGGATSGSGFGQNLVTGPTFGFITRLQQPRALRVGAAFQF